MKGAQQYIYDKTKREAEYWDLVHSESTPGKKYIVYKDKKNQEWHCNCTAGQIAGLCKHIKLMAEKYGEGDKCFYCGVTRWAAGGLDRNHVIMKGVDVSKANDEENIMMLCRRHHDRFHADQEFKENLQKLWREKKKI